MSFREETCKDENGNIIKKYYINNQPVSEHTYFSLSDDFYSGKPLLQNQNQEQDSEELCTCQECETLRYIIDNIKNMDKEDAVEYLRNVIETNVTIGQYQKQIDLYNTFGQQFFKTASQLDNEMEEYIDEMGNGNINEDGE